MKKEKFYAVSAGVTLAVSCVSSCIAPPTEVHADFAEFVGSVDYITGLSGADASGLVSSSGGAAAAGLVLAAYMLSNPNVNTGGTFDVSGCSYMSGLYLDETGAERFGCIIAPPQSAFPLDGGGITIMYGSGIDLRITSGTVATTFTNNGGRLVLTISSWCQIVNVVSPRNLLFGDWSDSNFSMVGLSNISPPALNTYLSYSSGSAFLALGASGIVPSGEMDRSDPNVYIENVLRPYIEINYPDYVYLLPEAPVEPTETLDPSETMPGLPVIQLPTVPPPEYDMELPEKMLEGAGFWFTALTEVLDEMGWLAIVIVLAVIAIVLYYVF